MSGSRKMAHGILACLLIYFTSGCRMWSDPYRVTSPLPPLAGTGEVVEAKAYSGWTIFNAFKIKVTFVGPKNRTWDADRIVRDAVAYLEDQSVWPQWQIESWSEIEKAPGHTARAKYIVLLDPVVVLGPTHGPLPGHYRPSSVERGLASHTNLTGPPREEGRTLDLIYPEGFFTGYRIPWHDDIQWFSPTLKVGPVPLSNYQVAPGRYEVPAGRVTLVMLREGEDLVVDVAPAKK